MKNVFILKFTFLSLIYGSVMIDTALEAVEITLSLLMTIMFVHSIVIV